MKPLPEQTPDAESDDPALQACVADLMATCATFTLPADRDASLARALAVQPTEQMHRSMPRTWRTGPWRTVRWRVSSVTLALLLILGGLGAYLHGQSPTPVSAQTVLQRAAAVSPGPNEASHTTYRLMASGGYTGTADAWVGTDAEGAPFEISLAVAMARNGQPAPELNSQSVLNGPTMRTYDAASNTVTVSAPGPSTWESEGMFMGVLVAQKLSRALAAGQQASFTLRQQTLNGVPVYALTLAQTGNQTFYFNTQTYALEGADWVQAGRSWQARLDPSGSQTMALAAVPPDTFTLNAPANAHVVALAPPAAPAVKGAGTDVVITTAAAACHSTPQAFSAAVQAGNKSMLAICQETAPGMTAQQLVAALLVPLKSSFDAQVASGAMTSAEESVDLAGLQAKLMQMVTAQPGSTPMTKQP